MTRVLHVGLNGVHHRGGPFERAAGSDEGGGDIGGERYLESFPTVALDDLPEGDAGIGDRCDERGVIDDASHGRGDGGESAGGEVDPDGVAHHVLEDVGLVEDDDVVLGQDRIVGTHVQAVEVGVHDHHVSGGGAVSGDLGEAGRAERTSTRARALVGGDAHCPPHRWIGEAVELGLVTGLARFGPTGERRDLLSAAIAEALEG